MAQRDEALRRPRKESKIMRESEIQDAVRLALGKLSGVDMCRNNVVQAVVLPYDFLDRCRGAAATGNAADVLAVVQDALKSARRVQAGLAKGASDLIGQVDGRFCSLEIKTPKGRVRSEQTQWLRRIRRHGGFAAVVRSVEQAEEAIKRCREGESE